MFPILEIRGQFLEIWISQNLDVRNHKKVSMIGFESDRRGTFLLFLPLLLFLLFYFFYLEKEVTTLFYTFYT